MSTQPHSPGTFALVARIGLLVAFAVALFVAGGLLGVALVGPTQPDAPTLPFGLGGDGPSDAVLVAPATAESPTPTNGSVSAAGNESAPSGDTGQTSSTATGRPLPPPD